MNIPSNHLSFDTKWYKLPCAFWKNHTFNSTLFWARIYALCWNVLLIFRYFWNVTSCTFPDRQEVLVFDDLCISHTQLIRDLLLQEELSHIVNFVTLGWPNGVLATIFLAVTTSWQHPCLQQGKKLLFGQILTVTWTEWGITSTNW